MHHNRDIKDWNSMADPAIVKAIGGYLRQMRLNKNISQEELAQITGLSRTTILRLEKGISANFMTIVQILRALGKLDILNSFIEENLISPIEMMRLNKKRRIRASHPRKNKKRTE